MAVAVEDLRVVIEAAKKLGGKVVLAGHSLGGSVVTAYATWDFAGQPGADGLSGLVFIDGGSGPTPITAEEAETKLRPSRTEGTVAGLRRNRSTEPRAVLVDGCGAGGVRTEYGIDGAELHIPALEPAHAQLQRRTRAVDQRRGLRLRRQRGHLSTQPRRGPGPFRRGARRTGPGEPYAWDGTGALTPIGRYAQMLSGAGVEAEPTAVSGTSPNG